MDSQVRPSKLDSEHSFDFSERNLSRKDRKGKLPLATKLFIDERKIIASFGKALSPLEADLIDVALACYVADRLALRQVEKNASCFQWTRNFRLKIGVRTPEIWSHEVKEDLSRLLKFLTDDEWDFELVPVDKHRRLKEVQGLLFPPIQMPAKVSLYSGGLDSFAGSVQEVSQFQDHSFVFVSGATNPRQQSAQAQQVRAIKKLSPREIHHVIIPFGIKQGKNDRYKEESSQRTRGFLFLILGVITALKAGVKTLQLYENGIGAINLPYDASQNGAMNSRSTHPLLLLRMESLLNRIFGEPFEIVNPFLFHTKGDMCIHQSVKSMSQFVPLTFSCDGFPVRTAGKPQCGFCTSCLLRRLSLEIAGLTAFDNGNWYIANLQSTTSSCSEKQLRNLKAMEWQYQRLTQLLLGPDKWENLIVEFPILETIVAEMSLYKQEAVDELQQGILQLYECYLSEWKSFSARRRLHPNVEAA